MIPTASDIAQENGDPVRLRAVLMVEGDEPGDLGIIFQATMSDRDRAEALNSYRKMRGELGDSWGRAPEDLRLATEETIQKIQAGEDVYYPVTAEPICLN